LSPTGKTLVYISRSRLHRNRANLVQTVRTVEAFVQSGIGVRLYMPPWKGRQGLATRLSDLGVAQPLDIHFSLLLHSRFRLRPFVLLHQRELRAADIVYVRHVDLTLELCRSRVPHVLEIHAFDRAFGKKGWLAPIVAAQRAGLVQHLLPISHAAAARLVEAGADPERVHVAPSGVDLPAFEAVEPVDPAELRHPRVVHIGSLSHDRGLAVFEALADSGVADVSLVGSGLTDVRPRPGLRMVDYVPHRAVAEWYGRSEIAVIPYQRDLNTADAMSPVKLFEAMAAGRAVVASDLPPIREIVVDGVNGLLVEPEDLDGWIAAVKRLSLDPDLATRLASAARSDAKKYSWRRRADDIARACGWAR
jgi:glycosyltransferase involved in cell wall biosynthesis